MLNRRTFLRRLSSLPLIGGMLALPGLAKAVVPAVAEKAGPSELKIHKDWFVLMEVITKAGYVVRIAFSKHDVYVAHLRFEARQFVFEHKHFSLKRIRVPYTLGHETEITNRILDAAFVRILLIDLTQSTPHKGGSSLINQTIDVERTTQMGDYLILHLKTQSVPPFPMRRISI